MSISYETLIARITTWIAKFLSFAGRVQVHNLSNVYYFYSDILVPIVCSAKEDSQNDWNIMKKFFWTGSVEISKKALVSCDKLCYPKSASGNNVIDVQM